MHKIFLPRLGQTMEEGQLLQWLVEPGADYVAGVQLYEVESDKATMEVEANLPGRLLKMLAEPGETVQVGALLAVAADPGETAGAEDVQHFLEADSAAHEDTAQADKVVSGPPAAENTTAPRHVNPGPVTAMPRTRALAKELGVDLATVTATGSNGQIIDFDVRATANAGAPPQTPQPGSSPDSRGSGPLIKERRPLGPIHRRMAEVVSRSWTQAPQFTQQVTVDASGWKERREVLRGEHGAVVTMTDLVLEALVHAVAEVPEVNAKFDGDALLIYEDVNVSIAVDTPAGLQVPVLHSSQALDVPERSARLRELAERARNGALSPDDVTRGTITLSNLGMHGIESGAPLVTAPQVAIVFIGTITDQVVPSPGRAGIEVRPQCVLSISYDHRALDGATAARFTAELRRLLEDEPS